MIKQQKIEIEVKDLTHAYSNQIVLSHCDLTVYKGENIGILGESGCGKSTLLKYLAGLYDAPDCNVIVAGQNEALEIRKQVALVMQEAFLLPGTIRENITCGHDMEYSWLEHVCETAGLTEWITTLSQGMDTYLGDRANELSGGQAQRIAIARAILREAPIMLLDEATSALDVETERRVLRNIMQQTKNKTCIVATHRPSVLSMCSRVYRVMNTKVTQLDEEESQRLVKDF